MRISVFTKLFNDRELEAVIPIVGELGFDAIEPMGRDPHLGPDTPAARVLELRDLLDEHDLDVANLGTYTGKYDDKTTSEREDELDDLRRFLEMADTLDCDLVRHHPGGPPEHRASETDYVETAKWMRRAADLAAEYDTRLCMELHHGSLVESVDGARRLLDLVDRPNLGVIHDAGNMYIADVPYGLDSVLSLDDRLFHVHLKGERRVDDADLDDAFEMENRNGRETFQQTLLDDGANDHDPVFAGLSEIGYDGFVSVECHVHGTAERPNVDIAAHELARVQDHLRSIN